MLNDYSMKENHMSKNCYKTEEAPPLKKSIIHKVEKQYGKDSPKTYATLWKIYKDKKKNEDAPSNSSGNYTRPDVDGSSSGGVARGDGKKKKKKKSPWDKYSPDALGKQFGGQAYRAMKMEMKEGKLLDRLAKLAKTGAEAEDVILTLRLDKKFKTGTTGLAWHNLVDTVAKLMKESVDAVAEPNITPDDTFAGVDVFNVNDDDYNNCKFGKKKNERWSNYVDMDSESGKRIYGYAKKNPKKSIIVQHDKTGHMLYLKKYDMGGES